MGLKVIGAGLPRTGTMSLQKALNILGYKAYHMEETIKNYKKGHIEMWHNHLKGESQIDWDKLYEDYDATTDYPGSYYFEELHRKYPNAKVILGVREPEKWYRSFIKLKIAQLLRFIFFIKVIRKAGLFLYDLHTAAHGKWDKETLLPFYHAHNEKVKATIPKEQLLIFSPKDGWEPLCKFLDKPIPDVPYPHLNAGSKTVNKKLRNAIFLGATNQSMEKL